ncbi:signal recognition particle, SRP19 subunit [Viridothelium virens]|uniref:Signal recognition particle, SRP19 subunit n=1 Tax=Viridothelium virens TaxID=1048519 RepID=A0A6A6GW81_VIRVR|nr:signal recognition particle, SRP19 subunit [Viridothelium virens]
MAHHARIEEVSDSDPDDMDPSDFDPTPSSSTTLPFRPTAPSAASSLMNPSAIPSTSSSTQPRQAYDPQKTKHYHCLYPLYFDASRTRTEGRRVPASAAVTNPLARTIVDAVATLGLSAVFEPGKTHPRDWANPGRVRVLLKQQDEGWERGRMGVQSKSHLYVLVSRYLAEHETRPDDPLRVRVPGLPPSAKDGRAPEGVGVPRGWKVGAVLPMHSPAVSGGGVSENLLKDMMAEMKGEKKPSELEAEREGGGGGGKAKKKKGKGKG